MHKSHDVCGCYLVVFMLEQTGQGLHTSLKGRVLWLHLTAESRHHCHGWVQCVLMHQVTTVPNETQNTVQPSSLKHSTRLSCADQLQNLKRAKASLKITSFKWSFKIMCAFHAGVSQNNYSIVNMTNWTKLIWLFNTPVYLIIYPSCILPYAQDIFFFFFTRKVQGCSFKNECTDFWTQQVRGQKKKRQVDTKLLILPR